MTEVSFHTNLGDRLEYGCRLLRKALRRDAQVAVVGPPRVLNELDRVLWTFDPLDFVPHLRLIGDAPVPDALRRTPVWLVDHAGAAPHHDVLLNLGDEVPEGFESFARVVELVGTDVDERALARQRWKHYAGRGYAIEHHEVKA